MNPQNPVPHSKREILSLTGLRGVAAFLIVLYHFGQPAGDYGLTSHYKIPLGYAAVDSFFMLSGFVLSYNYAETFLSNRARAVYGDFLVRRVARIYPAYFGVCLFYILKLMVNISADGAINRLEWSDWLANLLLATGWGFGIKPIIGDSWSVSAEIVCYFVFPLFCVIVFSKRFTSALLSGAVACVLYAVIWHNGMGVKGWLDVVDGASLFPLLRAFAGFILGMTIFQLYKLIGHRIARFSNILTVTALVFLVIATTYLGSDGIALAAIFLLVFGLSFDGKVARLLFGNRASMYLGRISYSLYLVHVIWIPVVARLALKVLPTHATSTFYIALFAFVTLCLGAATISYEIFEVRGKNVVMWLFRALLSQFNLDRVREHR